MTRCPCCNARLKEAQICPRCRADLNALINTKQAAHYYISKAVQSWKYKNIHASVQAINYSLHLQQIPLGLAFREFITQQQCQLILELLAKKQLLAAKRELVQSRLLIAHSQTLQQLQSFNDFLLVKKYEQSL